MSKAIFCVGLTLWIMLGCASTLEQKDDRKIDFNQPYLEFKFTYNYDVYEKPAFFLTPYQTGTDSGRDSAIIQSFFPAFPVTYIV